MFFLSIEALAVVAQRPDLILRLFGGETARTVVTCFSWHGGGGGWMVEGWGLKVPWGLGWWLFVSNAYILWVSLTKKHMKSFSRDKNDWWVAVWNSVCMFVVYFAKIGWKCLIMFWNCLREDDKIGDTPDASDELECHFFRNCHFIQVNLILLLMAEIPFPTTWDGAETL